MNDHRNDVTRYWDDRYPLHDARPRKRPSLIIHHFLVRQVKKKEGRYRKVRNYEDAKGVFADATEIPRRRLSRILDGDLPTAMEFDQITQATGWSLFFLLGMSEAAVRSRAVSYFADQGVHEPNPEQILWFERLYDRLLEIKLADDRAERSE